MNTKHYNNVIDWTLKHDQAAQTEDSLATARAIFNNMGIALPNGSMQEVYEISVPMTIWAGVPAPCRRHSRQQTTALPQSVSARIEL